MDEPKQPDPGTDSRVEDWFGQSVQRDAELADRLAADPDTDDPQTSFEEQATGRDEQEARHGDHIDPDQGQRAYRDDGS